jgi:hypothetical protein
MVLDCRGRPGAELLLITHNQGDYSNEKDMVVSEAGGALAVCRHDVQQRGE